MASEPERTLNEDAAKSIRYAYEGRPLETSAEADEGARQAPAPVPEEIRDFELSVGGYPEGCEPSGGVSHDASTDTDTAVGDAAISAMTASEESNDTVGVGVGGEAKPSIAKPQERLSWTTIDGKAKTSPREGIRVTFVFDETEVFGGDDDEIRQRINEVIRSGNKELLTALADTLHDALLA